MYSYIWNIKSETYSKVCFAKYDIIGIVPLWWREHCLECAMPLCYSTCQLFKPRMDGRCLRFDNGIVPVHYSHHLGAIISFRRWAKLESILPDNPSVIPADRIYKLQKCYSSIEGFIRKSSDILNWYRPNQVAASLTERINNKRCKIWPQSLAPDGFLAIINNLNSDNKTLIVEINEEGKTLYKTSLELTPGWNEKIIPMSEIRVMSTVARKRYIRAFLDNNQTGALEFYRFDFVKFNTDNAKPAKKVKCVAWDLDNTLWSGVIGDDGKTGVEPFESSLKLIKDLDERGIIQTIVSKNTPEIAWEKIEEMGMADYFLYPAINWGRKSQNLISIAKELNINIDTFAMIDDSSFERNEISLNLPQVRVFDAAEIPELLSKPEFDVPITEASRNRRQSYLSEYKRKNISASWEGDYDSFLRSCNIRMEVFKPSTEKEKERCLELILRSNQYNISGIKYESNEFYKMLESIEYDCFGFRVRDDYGDYGIVGFASFEKKGTEYILHDFVMSCRVALKKVERAFFSYIMDLDTTRLYKNIAIRAVKTARNAPLREQLFSMPFTVIEDTDEYTDFNFSTKSTFPDDGIIKI